MKSKLYQALINFFKKEDWTVKLIEDDSALVFGYIGDNGKWKCYARIREEQEQLVLYSLLPSYAPKTKRLKIAELFTRANYGLIIGNFEIDLTDGEIRCKTSIDVENSKLSHALIENMVYINLDTMDDHILAIQAVLDGIKTPLQALEMLEHETN